MLWTVLVKLSLFPLSSVRQNARTCIQSIVSRHPAEASAFLLHAFLKHLRDLEAHSNVHKDDPNEDNEGTGRWNEEAMVPARPSANVLSDSLLSILPGFSKVADTGFAKLQSAVGQALGVDMSVPDIDMQRLEQVEGYVVPALYAVHHPYLGAGMWNIVWSWGLFAKIITTQI